MYAYNAGDPDLVAALDRDLARSGPPLRNRRREHGHDVGVPAADGTPDQPLTAFLAQRVIMTRAPVREIDSLLNHVLEEGLGSNLQRFDFDFTTASAILIA